MKANFNVTGKSRRVLVSAIAEITGDRPKYLGMPTAAYEIGAYTVSRDGSVSCGNEALLEKLTKRLTELGFDGEISGEAEAAEPPGLTVSLPEDSAAIGNLTGLLEAWGALIKKALGIDGIGIRVENGTIFFPWFPERPAPDEIKAYTHFISALCWMSKHLKRVSAEKRETPNEKYAFRCLLLRLGFVGPEFKDERKILLRNLTGNASFKNGAPKRDAEG